MSTEKDILYLAWIIFPLCFFMFIPKDRQRNAQVAFLFKQFLTWITGIAIVEYGLIEFPVDIFGGHATRTSITFDFLVYPVLSAFFNVYYPETASRFGKFCYYAAYCSAMTSVELLLKNTTNLIKYIHWSGYHTFITLYIDFYISRIYYRWFFKIKR